MAIRSQGHRFNCHPDQCFSLSLCAPTSITRANAQRDTGKCGTELYTPIKLLTIRMIST